MSDYTTSIQSNHKVGYRHAQCRIMCDKHACTTLTRELSDAVFEDELSGLWVQSAEAVVQEHSTCVRVDRPSKGYALLLSTGKCDAVFTCNRGITGVYAT